MVIFSIFICIAATLPIFIGLFFKKRFALYEVFVSLFFILTMLVGGKTNQISAFDPLCYLASTSCIFLQRYRKQRDSKWIFYLVSFLSLLPIVFVKVSPAIHGPQSLFDFRGFLT